MIKMFAVCITICGCCNDNVKFSDINLENTVDSIKYIAVIEKDRRTIKKDNDIYTIKRILSKSYCIKPESTMKLPPYTGTMTIYCGDKTYVYQVYGNLFVSGGNTLHKAPINMSANIVSLGE